MNSRRATFFFRWFHGKSFFLAAGVSLALAVFLLPEIIQAQPSFIIPLLSFSLQNTPSAGLVLGPDNELYGVADNSGSITNPGNIFKLNRDGTGYRIIHQFTNNPDGAHPDSPLLLCNDGLFYGTTPHGGSNNVGTIFRISLNGSLYQVLHQFNTNANETGEPESLCQGVDGVLYGTAFIGGANGAGSIFKINPDGTGYQVLYNCTNTPAGVFQAGDGLLYSATGAGGALGYGTVFRLDTNGGSYQVLHTFTNTPDGSDPVQVIQAGNNLLYGVTYGGGISGLGTVFQLNPDGSDYQILHSFTNSPDGALPIAGLAKAWGGTLYGATYYGGSVGAGNQAQGVIYRIDPNGAYSVVSSSSTNHQSAELLLAAPSDDNSGVLYGITAYSPFAPVTIFSLVVTPGLTIAPVNNQSVVVWPAWAMNYVLQTTTNLASGAWTTMTNAEPLVGIRLPDTGAPTNSYFRLVWPQ